MRFWVRQILTEYFKQKWLMFLFITVFFCMGIIFGAFAVKTMNADQADHLSGYFNGFLEKVTTTSLSEQIYFRQNVLHNLYIMGALFLLGFTVVGIPFILITVFSRGFILGFTIGFLVKEKAVKGFAFALVSMFPHNIIVIPTVIIGGVTALSFSVMLLKRRFTVRNQGFRGSVVSYAAVMGILCLLTGAAGLIETYLTPVIVKTAAVYLR